jgi:ATP-dependent helicase/nuclease subunit A
LAEVWRKPDPGEIWRERAFEIVLDDSWISGVFDRVVVGRSADGRVASATVYDFKSDQIEDESVLAAAVERHTPQLNLYRRVAAVLTGLPASEVGCQLVFTARREIAPVPWR